MSYRNPSRRYDNRRRSKSRPKKNSNPFRNRGDTIQPNKSTALPNWADVRNLLVVRLDNIGDVIMTGPALRAIKHARPDVALTLMASRVGAQAARLLPWVDDIFVARVLWQDLGALPFDPVREGLLIREMAHRKFDGAIILTSFSQSPFPAGLACLLAGIPLRAGESKEHDGEILTNMPLSLPDDVHQVDRNLHLVRFLGFDFDDSRLHVKIDEQSRASAEQLLSVNGLCPGEPFILLNPWASARARTYPAGRFAEAALALCTKTGLRVVITGGTNEKPYSQEVSSVLGRKGVDLVGLTTVSELAALVSNAGLVLTTHTSVMHLADALGRPEVVLFSGTDLESQWMPRLTDHVLLRRPTSCSPCYAFNCTELRCLDISPEEVVSAGLRLINGV